MKFEELELIEPILRALEDAGYKEPSPIQEKAIPVVLEGRDLVGCAQTGTGKTAAFGLPMIQKLYTEERTGKRTVLTPTRELALQIFENLENYAKYTGISSAVVFGGVSQNPQVEALRRGVDILVATPGRLMDLYGQGHVDLRDVHMLVLDEADRMLDMGFVRDVRRIIGFLPKERQTLLFSATMPDEILSLISTFLKDPVEIAVNPISSPVELISQSVYFVDKNNKIKLLRHLLKDPKLVSVLVFTRTKHGADRVERELRRAGISAAAIHGDKTQQARQQALNRFKAGKVRVLVATDIAARGIDVVELSHVINYNLPDIPETYVHRIGRTGRAGHEGVAISFCDYDELPCFDAIEQLIGCRIPQIGDHPYPMMQVGGGNTEPHKPSERVAGDSALFAKAKAAGLLNQPAQAKNREQKKTGEQRRKQPAKRPQKADSAHRSGSRENASAAAPTKKQPERIASAARRQPDRRPAQPAARKNAQPADRGAAGKTKQAVKPVAVVTRVVVPGGGPAPAPQTAAPRKKGVLEKLRSMFGKNKA